MSARVTHALLPRPAALATRVVANARLDACLTALEQMDAGAPEALHDLRVSLRRLRSWLRTFRPYLDDTVRGRSYRRLRRLVRATNGARDLEVWSEWLAGQSVFAARERAGARYLAAALANDGEAAHTRALDRVRRRVPKIANALRDDLATYTLHVRGGASVDHRMSAAVADALRSGCRRLLRRAARVEVLTDVAAIHATRIAAKKLRYLAETLESTEAADAAQALSELQDVLGAVHDMQLLVVRILGDVEAAGGADARRRAQLKVGLEAGERPELSRRAVAGLTEVAARAQRRAHEEFDKFVREWKDGRIDDMDTVLTRVANDVEQATRRSD
jgi:CHAD domain-containing protein